MNVVGLGTSYSDNTASIVNVVEKKKRCETGLVCTRSGVFHAVHFFTSLSRRTEEIIVKPRGCAALKEPKKDALITLLAT